MVYVQCSTNIDSNEARARGIVIEGGVQDGDFSVGGGTQHSSNNAANSKIRDVCAIQCNISTDAKQAIVAGALAVLIKSVHANEFVGELLQARVKGDRRGSSLTQHEGAGDVPTVWLSHNAEGTCGSRGSLHL
jgi:hypothetical protein